MFVVNSCQLYLMFSSIIQTHLHTYAYIYLICAVWNGYVSGQKGYKVLLPSTNSIEVSRHAAFDSMISSLRTRKVEFPHLYLEDPYPEIYLRYFERKIEPSPFVQPAATTERGNADNVRLSTSLNSSSAPVTMRNSSLTDDIEDGVVV